MEASPEISRVTVAGLPRTSVTSRVIRRSLFFQGSCHAVRRKRPGGTSKEKRPFSPVTAVNALVVT